MPTLAPTAVGVRRQHQVANPDIGKGTAHHHLVMAAAGAVGVEVGALDPLCAQPLPRRRRLAERARRRDVVGGHGIAEQQQRAGAANVAGSLRRQFEERRPGNVGRRWPVVYLAARRRNRLPQILVCADIGVAPTEGLRIERQRQHGANLVRTRPDVPQIHRQPIDAGSQGLSLEVDVHPTGNRECHHQRRRRQIVGTQSGVDPRLEVAVAREHRRSDQLLLGDRPVERRIEIAGVADAGRAAITDEREAQFGQRRQQPRAVEIIGHHPRTGSERSLDVLPDLQPLCHRLPRQQPGSDHHRRIAGVGARGDRRNQDVAMTEVDAGEPGRMALRQARRRPSEAVRRLRSGQQGVEAAGHLGQGDPVLRPLRASERGNDRRQVQVHAARIVDLARARDAEQALGAEIRLEQLAVLIAAAAAAHVADGLLVDREETHRRPVLRRHVGQRRAVGHRQRARALAEILDEGADDLLAPQQFGHRQH